MMTRFPDLIKNSKLIVNKMWTTSLIFVVTSLSQCCYGNFIDIESLYSSAAIKEVHRGLREAPVSLDSLPPFVMELYPSFSRLSGSNEDLSSGQDVQFLPIEKERGKYSLDFTEISSDSTVAGVDFVIEASNNHIYRLRNGVHTIVGERKGGSVIFDLDGLINMDNHDKNTNVWLEISSYPHKSKNSPTNYSSGKVPVLVVYRNVDKHALFSDLKRREKRNTDQKKSPDPEGKYSKLASRQSTKSEACQLIPWTVDFNVLGWHQILAPGTFIANRCEGRCPTLMNAAKWNSTNYAFIKSQYKIKLGHQNLGDPCCTPAVYAPQSIIYAKNGTVILKTIPQMRVLSCGCR